MKERIDGEKTRYNKNVTVPTCWKDLAECYSLSCMYDQTVPISKREFTERVCFSKPDVNGVARPRGVSPLLCRLPGCDLSIKSRRRVNYGCFCFEGSSRLPLSAPLHHCPLFNVTPTDSDV